MTLPNRPAAVEEIITEATTTALNGELSQRGIPADRIISILPLPGQALGVTAPPQFRVLYRAG